MTQRLELTPVLEEFSQLRLTTPPRQVRDDFGVTPWRVGGLEVEEMQRIRAGLEEIPSVNFSDGPPSERPNYPTP